MIKDGDKIFFRSPGKLLITGEYLVLHGAEALSLPVRFGQSLEIWPVNGIPALLWRTIVNKKIWFEATFSIPDFVIGNTSDFPTAQALRTLLLNARYFNPEFLLNPERFDVVSELDYDIAWGLGSSSSLTVNIAAWAKINPFDLHFKTYSGSGFDVASAYSGKSLVYSLKDNKPGFIEVDFKPSFMNEIWFVYLGKKKSSSEAITKFEKNRKLELIEDIEKVSAITREIVRSKDVDTFIEFLHDHDHIISDLNGIKPLSERVFRDFKGYSKYLGAWGGDFAMLVSSYPGEYITSWLKKNDFKIWFPYKKIISD